MELKLDDEVFRVYALSIGVLMAKFLMMSFLTARQRFANMVCTWIPKNFFGASYFSYIYDEIIIITMKMVIIRSFQARRILLVVQRQK